MTSEKDPESGSSSDSGSDSDDDEGKRPEEDTLLADLLKEASESESSEDEKSQATPRKTKSARKPRNTYELPAGNIAVLMMACWTMRLPVMYKDFIRYVDFEDVRDLLIVSFPQSDRRIQASLPGGRPVAANGNEAPPGTRNDQYAESTRRNENILSVRRDS